MPTQAVRHRRTFSRRARACYSSLSLIAVYRSQALLRRGPFLLAQLELPALAGRHHALPAPLAWCQSHAPRPAMSLVAAGSAVLQGKAWMEVEQPVRLAARTSLLLQGSARRARRNLSLMPAPQFAHARLTFMASTVKLLARRALHFRPLLLGQQR